MHKFLFKFISLLTYLGFSTREGETQEEGREKFHLLDSIGRLEAVSVSLCELKKTILDLPETGVLIKLAS